MPNLSASLRALMISISPARKRRTGTTPSGSSWRKSCSACGSRAIAWTRLAHLEDSPFKDAVLPALGQDAEAWVCATCGEAGAFEATDPA